MKTHAVVPFGYAVLVAICLMLLSSAYLRGGHPPGSGIVNLLVLMLTYPMSLYGAIVGWTARPEAIAIRTRPFYVMTGVCLCFAVAVTLGLVVRYILGKPI
jgi:hypothetical protein